MSRGNPEAVKVVFIDTQYVETDATSFKSVVQKLTGKDCAATAAGHGPVQSERTIRAAAAAAKSSGVGERSGGGGGGGASLSRGVSFKEPDRLLMELTPSDELYRLSAD